MSRKRIRLHPVQPFRDREFARKMGAKGGAVKRRRSFQNKKLAAMAGRIGNMVRNLNRGTWCRKDPYYWEW